MEIKHKITNEVLLTIEGDTLQGVNLQCVNLQYADLQGVNLRWANLQEANLQAANLQAANLKGANLQEANLQAANLQAANLKGANLQGASLKGANLPTEVIRIDGLRWDVTILHGHMRIGCQHHHVDDWTGFSDDEISEMHDDAMKFWQANKGKLITIANFTKE